MRPSKLINELKQAFHSCAHVHEKAKLADDLMKLVRWMDDEVDRLMDMEVEVAPKKGDSILRTNKWERSNL